VRAYDWVLIDCPPALGVLAANALVAADQVLIPVQPEYFALQGMAKLMEVIALVPEAPEPIAADPRDPALPRRFRERGSRQEVLAEIRSHFPGLLSKTTIRTNVKLAEAPSFGKTIFEHAPESNGATDYLAFAAEFLDTGEAASQPGTPAAAEDLAAGA
jgi:chromosome partitioning protein